MKNLLSCVMNKNDVFIGYKTNKNNREINPLGRLGICRFII